MGKEKERDKKKKDRKDKKDKKVKGKKDKKDRKRRGDANLECPLARKATRTPTATIAIIATPATPLRGIGGEEIGGEVGIGGGEIDEEAVEAVAARKARLWAQVELFPSASLTKRKLQAALIVAHGSNRPLQQLGNFGSGDHEADVQEFCEKNELDPKTQDALERLNAEQQKKVMGTDGGENSFYLKDKVKSTNAVVMSRIRRL
eukprot:s589_g4.t1